MPPLKQHCLNLQCRFCNVQGFLQVLSGSMRNTEENYTDLAVKEGMAWSWDFNFHKIHLSKSKKWPLILQSNQPVLQKTKEDFYRGKPMRRFLPFCSWPGCFYRWLLLLEVSLLENSGKIPQGLSSRNSFTERPSRNIFEDIARQSYIDYKAVWVGHFVHSK